MKEATLSALCKKRLPGHWTNIENAISSGVPDVLASRNGYMAWIEFKRNYRGDIILRPLQRVWAEREIRHNPSVYIMFHEDEPIVIPFKCMSPLDPVIKGGKLHYRLYDLEHAYIVGWEEIDQELFT
jgi:hypothetical protein